jgi:hypothetical protein
VRTLSLRQIRREKLDIDQAPAIKRTDRVNTRTGEVFKQVPEGIDPGWDYNVGKAWQGPDTALGEHIMRMPDGLRTQALADAQNLVPHLAREFSPWANRLIKRKRPLGEIKTIGYIGPELVSQLAQREKLPVSALITATDKEVMHMLREAKDGKHLPVDMIRNLPNVIGSPKAVLWDKRNPALLYVFDPPGDTRKGKVVIRVNYKIKARGADSQRHSITTNSLRTGGLVDTSNLKDESFYEVIEGKL